MKKVSTVPQIVALLIAVLLLLVPLVMAGCAARVPQEEYDRVKSDLEAAQSRIQELEDAKAKAAAYIEVLNWYVEPLRVAAGESPRYEWTPAKINSKIEGIGDVELEAKWDAFWEAFQEDAPKVEEKLWDLTDYMLDTLSELSK